MFNRQAFSIEAIANFSLANSVATMHFMDVDRIWNLVTNPAWRPLTNADLPGYAVLGVCAAALIGLTFWTYLGSSQTTPRRLFVLVTLRLLALIIAILTALRPALSV